MKKQIIISLVILLALLPTVLATICPADNAPDISEIPCEEITPIIQNQTLCNVTIVNLNDSDINYTINMTHRVDDTWNYSLGYSLLFL